jgi:hypothetical protein
VRLGNLIVEQSPGKRGTRVRFPIRRLIFLCYLAPEKLANTIESSTITYHRAKQGINDISMQEVIRLSTTRIIGKHLEHIEYRSN